MTSSFVRTTILLALVVFAAGCKKKQKTTPAPAAQAPTITAPAPNTSAPATETKTGTSASVPDKPPSTTEAAKSKPKPKPIVKKTPPPKPANEPAKPSESPAVAKAAPPRIVVQPAESSPSETTTVVPDMSHTEEAHHRQTTEQLMQSTEANLKSLKRVLNTDERAIYQQIQLFMAQSKEATQSQDLLRAHNLALKAHLLSDELVR